jgi:uncharacterized protein (TIGR00106 family)
MNTLIAVAIAPFGVGDELASYVADAVAEIADSGLKYKTTSMFTEIEGEWDEVMDTVKRATFALAGRGIRTEVILKADVRPGYEGMMDGKIERLNKALDACEGDAAGADAGEAAAGAVSASAASEADTAAAVEGAAAVDARG